MGNKKSTESAHKDSRYQVPALARGLKILEFVASNPDGCTVTEVVANLKLPKPSAFRMMVTLVEQGYLQRDDDGSVYRLSRKMLSLGYAAVDSQGLVEKSMDVLRKLRDIIGETTTLSVLSGNEGIMLEQAPSRHAVKVIVQIGHRFPLHTAAPGKALLAFLPDDERDSIIDSLEYKKFTETTITSRTDFLEELKKVKAGGVAFDRGEELDDLRCVAAPILDAYGYPLAALCVNGPSSRVKEKDLARFSGIVAAHAKMITERFSR
ncbi:MAG: IclR family transcriptional regulator [Spirochaetes bacterium]|nr:IclR family transcriptional regulator [Spirochaetota bacterium]